MDVSDLESDYARRNAVDPIIKLPTMKEYNATDQMNICNLFATAKSEYKNYFRRTKMVVREQTY